MLRPRAWEAAGEQVAAARRRLAGLAPEERDGWASAAREASGCLAALARRLQPEQRAQLARASDALARAGEVPHGARRGHVDPALVALSGVARVAADASLTSHASLVSPTALVRELAALAVDLGAAHDAAARAGEAEASRLAAEHTLAYLRTVSTGIAERVMWQPLKSETGLPTSPSRSAHQGLVSWAYPAARRQGEAGRGSSGRERGRG